MTSATVPTPTEVEATGVGVAKNDFVTVDLTGLVRDWIDGVVTNDGIALIPNGSDVNVLFDSKEAVLAILPARLIITMVAAGASTNHHWRIYRALLTQTDTNAPVATALETIGQRWPSRSRRSAGRCSATTRSNGELSLHGDTALAMNSRLGTNGVASLQDPKTVAINWRTFKQSRAAIPHRPEKDV